MRVNGQDKRELIAKDQRLEQWHQIWNARVSGLSPYKIAMQFDLTVQQVNNVLSDFRKQYIEERDQGVEQELQLDLERCNNLIAIYTPVAEAMTVMVQKTNSQGESYTEDEWIYPLHAGKMILSAIKMRSQLMGYDSEKSSAKASQSDLWLRRSEEARVVNNQVKVKPVDQSAEDPLDLSFDSE